VTRHHQPSGLQRGLELWIDPNWSPAQAMAVIELLNDLRDRIWAHYEFTLMDEFREESATRIDVEITDPPF
jgi:hypothetical protein